MYNLYKNTYPTDWYVFENCFNDEEYKKLFNGLEKLSFQKAAQGGDTQELFDSHRISNVKWIPKIGPWNWLYKKLSGFVHVANKECWNFDLHSIVESIQYTEYNGSQKGHYGWHVDLGPGPTSLRKVSVTIQLSGPEDYKGGDFEFNVGKDNPPSPKDKGTGIIFPSYLLHRVTPVTKGIRKSLVLWVGGCTFK